MIFSDIAFVVFVFLPYLIYVAVLHGARTISPTIKLGLLIALSAVYYVLGPESNPLLYSIFVAGNLYFVLVPVAARTIIAVCIVNIAALFLIKALRPAGAPLAISFLVFQVTGLLITRLRRGDVRPTAPEFLFLLVYFPHMIAGPIVQWGDIRRWLGRLRDGVSAPRAWDMAFLFLSMGLAKKVLIADRLFEPISHLQAGTGNFGFVDSVLFPLLYGMYLYFDFSSYSDIATGLALLIGLRFPINFYSPYRASDPRSFWRRWHRTLYRFLRNYLRFIYEWLRMPRGRAFIIFVFMFSGMWHGVGLGFAIWAAGHAAWFLLYPRRLMTRLPRLVSWAANLSVVMLLWVPFALKPDALVRWLNGLGSVGSAMARDASGYTNIFLNRYDLIVIVVATFIALVMPNVFQWARRQRFVWAWRASALILFLGAWPYVVDPASPRVPFAYFQF